MSLSDAARAYWAHPGPEALRVWADALAEAGDPRGEFIQLSLLDAPTPEQRARRKSLHDRLGGKLVGPARPYLRSWYFGPGGLVDNAVTEARRFLDGFEALCGLNPRLQLAVTALRKQPDVTRVAALPLRRIHALVLEWCAMTDETLRELAPALAGVKHLSLAFNDVTAEGLAALAPYAHELESLALGTSTRQMSKGGALGDAWVSCLCDAPGFQNLRLVSLFNYQRPPAPPLLERLRQLPRLAHIRLAEPPYGVAALEALMQAPRADGATVERARHRPNDP